MSWRPTEAFSDAEPRLPAGPGGGQWTSGGGGGAAGGGKAAGGAARKGKREREPRSIDFHANARDAVEALSAGERVTVGKENVRAVMMKALKNGDHPDISQLKVEGLPIFRGGLNIERAKMPQIPKEHVAGYLDSLKAQGIAVKTEKVDPLTLLPSQNEISGTKVGGMIQKFEDGSKPFKTIFVSKDHYVADGHHHWAAAATMALESTGIKQPVMRVMAGIETVISTMHAYMKEHGLKTKKTGEAVGWVAREASWENEPRVPSGAGGGQWTSGGGGGDGPSNQTSGGGFVKRQDGAGPDAKAKPKVDKAQYAAAEKIIDRRLNNGYNASYAGRMAKNLGVPSDAVNAVMNDRGYNNSNYTLTDPPPVADFAHPEPLTDQPFAAALGPKPEEVKAQARSEIGASLKNSSSPISNADSVGGNHVNETYHLTMADGREYLLKPTDGEQGSIHADAMDVELDRPGEYYDESNPNPIVDGATLADREVLTAKIGGLLGLRDQVPDGMIMTPVVKTDAIR